MRVRIEAAVLPLMLFAAELHAQAPRDTALARRIMELRAAVEQAHHDLVPQAKPGTATIMRRDEGLVSRLRSVDSIASSGIEAIIDTRGWPGRALVGDEAAHAAFTLVRLGKLSLKRKALVLLQKAVSSGDASALDAAYLLDDTQVALGEPQTYGTRLQFVNNHFEAAPIADSSGVDARRRTVGLGALADSVAAVKVVGMPMNAITVPPGKAP
jgi:hypothetical protein